jgi:hypothetical protein
MPFRNDKTAEYGSFTVFDLAFLMALSISAAVIELELVVLELVLDELELDEVKASKRAVASLVVPPAAVTKLDSSL